VKPGTTSDVPAITTDLYPTLLEACGVKPEGQVDGVSLVPLLRGKEAPERPRLFWHYPHYSNQGGKPGGAVVAGNYKFIEFYEDGRRELFYLDEDPGESRNRAGEKLLIVRVLAKYLDEWRKDVGALMP